MVVTKGDGLDFALAPQVTPAAAIPASRAGAPEGGVYEVSPAATSLTEEIGRVIAAHGGAALLLDYGYTAIGFGETLQAVGKHRFASLLEEPGAKDLSAHVDFTALADAARHGGAAVYGPCGQGALLEALGLSARAKRLADANPAEAAAVYAAAQRLTAPDQMGTLFQGLALTPSSAARPPGF
jgi:NADH dehydrogenase [ubiquinone] 1 alpha subcomplex assembly factor 7